MIKFHGYFKDGAVVQRNSPVIVKGYANGEVEVELKSETYNHSILVNSQEGKFTAVLPAVTNCSEEYCLTAKSNGETSHVKILFGDVFITAGQSNMSYVLSGVEDSKNWIKRAKKQKISVISLTEKPFTDLAEVVRPYEPLEDFIDDYEWVTEEGDLRCVSAISVQMATAIAEKKGIPIGVVHTAMGGLGVESYLRREDLDEEMVTFLKEVGRYSTKENYNKVGVRNFSQLQGVWNEKIAPILGFSFSGFIWYLGESSAYDFRFGVMFKKSMDYLINAVKNEFSAIPFVCVEIAPEYYPYGDKYGYSYVNEALQMLDDKNNGVFTIPIYDIEPRWNLQNGDWYFHPIHTTNKSLVSERIAKVLTEEFAFPRIIETQTVGNKIICKIQSLKPLKKGRVRGFTVANENGKYYPAKAIVKKSREVEVWSEEVENPVLVTYAFTQYQDFCDLKDVDGNPAFTYRTNIEPVNGNYFFTPAFMTEDAKEVYENNFGWEVGTCRKRKVWDNGKIYEASRCEIDVKGEEITVSAKPNVLGYFMFGVSPSICMSGHKHYLDSFNYLNFSLKANKPSQFFGVVIRTADGAIYRYELLNGNTQENVLPIEKNYRKVAINLKKGFKGDFAPIEFGWDILNSIVEIEFLFRSAVKSQVKIKGLSYSNFNRSIKGAVEKTEEKRADINLPT